MKKILRELQIASLVFFCNIVLYIIVGVIALFFL